METIVVVLRRVLKARLFLFVIVEVAAASGLGGPTHCYSSCSRASDLGGPTYRIVIVGVSVGL